MAKPFYSLEEACAKLGKSDDEVRALVRDGELREFRDAGKVFFKAEDVDKLAGGGGGDVMLEPVEDELPTLADTKSGTSMIGLAPLEEEKAEKKEDTVVPPSGIGVFEDDELEVDADPMAKTQITAATTGDQVQLDGGGTGSGLLDLTREADDTSLGAELLDEIHPGEEEVEQARARAPEPEEEEPVEEAPAYEPAITAPVIVGDTSEGLFGGLLVGALVLVAFGGSVAAGVMQGFLPGYADYLAKNMLVILLPVTVGTVGLATLIGWLIGRATATRR